jgi:hypothetical protein
MKDVKRSKLKVISIFDLQSMFCTEHEIYRLKWSDSSGIRNLTSIPFWTSKARKIKKKEYHANLSFESQISQSATVDLSSFRLEYLELQKSIWYKLNFVGFLTQRSINVPNFSLKWCLMREMIFVKMTHEFCHQTGFVKNKSKVLLKASKPSSKSLFQQFSSSKSKVKAWRFYARLFLLF